MAGKDLRARILDSSIVSITFPEEVSNSNFSSFLEIAMPDSVRELGASGLGFGRWVAAELGIVSFEEQYELGGGTLLIGSALTEGMTADTEWLQRIAVWEGSGFSLKTTQIGGDPAALVAFFEQLDITEYSDGVVALPMVPEVQVVRTGWHGPQLATTLSEFGIVHVRELTPDLARDLPDQPGYPAAGGDLYVVPGERQDVLVLVGHGAYTKLYPGNPLESEVLAFAFNLVVKWESSSSARPMVSRALSETMS